MRAFDLRRILLRILPIVALSAVALLIVAAALQATQQAAAPYVLVATFADPAELGKAVTADWNAVHIQARGRTLTHLINGQLMTVVTDDDAPNRPADGLLGVQVHVGPPMKVEYRNIRLKTW